VVGVVLDKNLTWTHSIFLNQEPSEQVTQPHKPEMLRHNSEPSGGFTNQARKGTVGVTRQQRQERFRKGKTLYKSSVSNDLDMKDTKVKTSNWQQINFQTSSKRIYIKEYKSSPFEFEVSIMKAAVQQA
jgi:hypothetical protein